MKHDCAPRLAFQRFLRSCLLSFLTAGISSLSAQTDAGRPAYGDADWALLPAWCVDTQDGPFGSPSFSGVGSVGQNKSPRSERWTGLFGADFWHMHHYCRGLYAERRALRPAIPAPERVEALNRALGEYFYVINNCRPTMPLMPEVHYRAGVLYLRKGDRALAGDAFASSRRIKPDYWPAYVRWADELIALRLFDQADTLIREGLGAMPDGTELLQAQQRLAARRREPRRSGAQ